MKNYIVILAITVFTQGLSLLGNIYFANSVDVLTYSKYVSALSIVTIVTTILMFGLPQYIVRESILNGVMTKYSQVMLISSLLTIFILFCVNVFYYNNYIYCLIPFALILILSTYLSAVYQVTKEYYKITLSQVSKDVARLFFLSAITLFGFKFIEVNLIVTTSIVLIILLINHYLILKKTRTSKVDLCDALKSSTPFLISSLSYTIYYQSDTIVLTYYGYSVELASYALVITMMTACLVVNNTLYQTYLLPIFYSLYKKSPREARALSLKFFYITMLLITPFLIIYHSYSADFFSMFVNKKYIYFMDYMNVIVYGVIIRYIYSPLGLYMNLKDNVSKKSYILVVAVIMNVTLNMVFVPLYGPKTVTYTTVMTETAVMAGFFIIFYLNKSQKNEE